jgi:hypothetical protein
VEIVCTNSAVGFKNYATSFTQPASLDDFSALSQTFYLLEAAPSKTALKCSAAFAVDKSRDMEGMKHLCLLFLCSINADLKDGSLYTSLQHDQKKIPWTFHRLEMVRLCTVSWSISSSSGTCGGLKKLKKLSHRSVFVTGFVFFAPFLGFFFKTFVVKFFPGIHSISVLQNR